MTLPYFLRYAPLQFGGRASFTSQNFVLYYLSIHLSMMGYQFVLSFTVFMYYGVNKSYYDCLLRIIVSAPSATVPGSPVSSTGALYICPVTNGECQPFTAFDRFYDTQGQPHTLGVPFFFVSRSIVYYISFTTTQVMSEPTQGRISRVSSSESQWTAAMETS